MWIVNTERQCKKQITHLPVKTRQLPNSAQHGLLVVFLVEGHITRHSGIPQLGNSYEAQVILPTDVTVYISQLHGVFGCCCLFNFSISGHAAWLAGS